MNNDAMKLYNALRKGDKVNPSLIPGLINTPEIPLSVFDKEEMKLPSGPYTKLNFNSEKFLQYLQSIVNANTNGNKIEDKVIAHSQFYRNLQDVQRRLENNEVVHDPVKGDYVGIYWLYDGRNCPIQIPVNRIPAWDNTISTLIETAMQPTNDNTNMDTTYSSHIDKNPTL